MLGYLVMDRDFASVRHVRQALDAMTTVDFIDLHDLGHSIVVLFRNEHSNNYLSDSPDHLLVASGTLIYKGLRGGQALQSVGRALPKEGDITSLYDDLRGHYNLLLVERSSTNVRLVTDREGLQFSFMARRGAATALSSSQLLLAAISDPPLDPNGIREFIHLGMCFEDKTFFASISRVPAATELVRGPGGWRSRRLWTIGVAVPALPDTLPEIVAKTSAVLSASVQVASQIEAERVLADLTGGTDSRTVLSFLLRAQPGLTVNAVGAADHVDIRICRRIAKKLGLRCLWLPPDDQPDLSPAALERTIEVADGVLSPFDLVRRGGYLRTKAEKYTMVFGGAGGPLHKDHFWLFEFNRTGLFREPNWRRIAKLSIINYNVQDDLFIEPGAGIIQHMQDMMLSHSAEVRGTNNQKIDYVYFTLKCPAFIGAWATISNKFHDVYHPLMDGDIVEYLMNVRPEARKYNLLQFSMIYNNSKKLAWTLTDTGVPAVPAVGPFMPLRALHVRRYARSAARKLKIFMLKRQDRSAAVSIDPVARALWQAGYLDALDHRRLSFGSMLSRPRLDAMRQHPETGSNGIYLLNTLAVELFIKRAAEIRRGC